MTKSIIGLCLFVLVALVVIGMLVGFVRNIVRLCYCDFEAPYKAEIIRGIGIFIPPVGGIVGWINIPDWKEQHDEKR